MEKEIYYINMEDIQTKTKILQISEPKVQVPVSASNGVSKDSGIATNRWTFGELLGQKRFIGEYSFADTKNVGGETIAWEHTFDGLKQILGKDQEAWINLFLAKKWRVKFTLEVESNFQQVGLFMMYFCNIPLNLRPMYIDRPIGTVTPPSDADVQRLPLATAWMLDKQLIQLGHNGVYEIEMPWQVPLKAHIDSSTGYNLWNTIKKQVSEDVDNGVFVIRPVVPMTVATGVSTTCVGRLWASVEFDELSMYAPRPQLPFGVDPWL